MSSDSDHLMEEDYDHLMEEDYDLLDDFASLTLRPPRKLPPPAIDLFLVRRKAMEKVQIASRVKRLFFRPPLAYIFFPLSPNKIYVIRRYPCMIWKPSPQNPAHWILDEEEMRKRQYFESHIEIALIILEQGIVYTIVPRQSELGYEEQYSVCFFTKRGEVSKFDDNGRVMGKEMYFPR